MFAVTPTPLPSGALIARYADDPANFTDCYRVDVAGTVTLADYVAAFYTTRLFKLERGILSVVLKKRATDEDARALGDATSDAYSAWTVEARSDTQLLMCPVDGKTRSWFMVEPGEAGATTRLYFGSAVLRQPRHGIAALAFKPLLLFHKLYSLALLSAAKTRLGR